MHNGEQSLHERRSPITISEEQLDEIAERAAEKAISKLTDHVYLQVGRSVVNKLLWIIGAVFAGGYIWLHSKGYMK